jgi:hypothetical protein
MTWPSFSPTLPPDPRPFSPDLLKEPKSPSDWLVLIREIMGKEMQVSYVSAPTPGTAPLRQYIISTAAGLDLLTGLFSPQYGTGLTYSVASRPQQSSSTVFFLVPYTNGAVQVSLTIGNQGYFNSGVIVPPSTNTIVPGGSVFVSSVSSFFHWPYNWTWPPPTQLGRYNVAVELFLLPQVLTTPVVRATGSAGDIAYFQLFGSLYVSSMPSGWRLSGNVLIPQVNIDYLPCILLAFDQGYGPNPNFPYSASVSFTPGILMGVVRLYPS